MSTHAMNVSMFRLLARRASLCVALALATAATAHAADVANCSSCQGTWRMGMTAQSPSCTFTWSGGTSAGNAIDLGNYPTSGVGALQVGGSVTSTKLVPFSLSVSSCDTPLSQISVTFSGQVGTKSTWFLLGPASNNLAFLMCKGTALPCGANIITNGLAMPLVTNATPAVPPNGKVADFIAAPFAPTAGAYADTGANGVTTSLAVVISYN